MDREWMRERLQAFVALCETYDQQSTTVRRGGGGNVKELTSRINTDIPTVREIIKHLDPDGIKEITSPNSMYGTAPARRVATQALGILRDQEEWKTRLAPDAPSLVA